MLIFQQHISQITSDFSQLQRAKDKIKETNLKSTKVEDDGKNCKLIWLQTNGMKQF